MSETTPPQTSPSQALAALAEDYWQRLLKLNPRLATFIGDNRYDDRLEDIGPEGRQADTHLSHDLLGRLTRIDREALSTDERVSWDMLKLAAEQRLTEIDLRLDELGIDQMEGPQVWLPDLLNWHPTDTAEGVQKLVSRYQAFPAYMSQYLENLQDGIRDGRTTFHSVVERVIGQLEALLATPAATSPLAQTTSTEGKPTVVEVINEDVYPAFRRFLDFVQGDYVNKLARTEPGISAVTRGPETYAYLCRRHTTTDLTPDEIHAFGRQDLAALHDEMRALMRELGETSDDPYAFAAGLSADPSRLPSNRDEVVTFARQLVVQAEEILPQMLGTLPLTPCVVKAVEDFREKDSPAAFYYPPSASGDRPGVFYVNCFLQMSQPMYELPGIAFHEAVPGHHVQIALAQERTDLPSFRRLSSDMTAYVEGWALYTERLSDEFHLYLDEYARFGMLVNQAWRACRLVVDTGLHYLHWSRQQAIDFMRDNAFLSDENASNEIDRYIIIPGQALSYKIGQREIERARHEATSKLGAAFNLRAFHDEVLRFGPIPLSTLRSVISAWVTSQSR